MGHVHFHHPVKLFCGILFLSEKELSAALLLLQRSYGVIDKQSKTVPFTWTNYYNAEMQSNKKKPIYRQFVSFQRMIQPEKIVAAKLRANRIENILQRKAGTPGRVVNLDPGYITLHSLVLATTKNYQHRIYLSKGIFAENTLQWDGQRYLPWPWTYPDYQSSFYQQWFTAVRSEYHTALKHAGVL